MSIQIFIREPAAARGWVTHTRFADSAGWSLTEAGRVEDERRMASLLRRGLQEDGYAVVADFLERQRARGNARMESSLKARGSTGKYPDAYSGDLISHYMDDLGGLSVWALLEVTDAALLAEAGIAAALKEKGG